MCLLHSECLLMFDIPGQEQRLQGSSSQCSEHRRSVRGAAVWSGSGHHGGHPGVLLEQSQERDE